MVWWMQEECMAAHCEVPLDVGSRDVDELWHRFLPGAPNLHPRTNVRTVRVKANRYVDFSFPEVINGVARGWNVYASTYIFYF